MHLGHGLWGPLAELDEIPRCAISDFSLEVMGTTGSVYLAHPRESLLQGAARVLEIYGPPTRQAGDRLEYDWLFAPRPRKMWFRVNGAELLLAPLDGAIDAGLDQSPGSDPRYTHPYYWAPFILIGDWR